MVMQGAVWAPVAGRAGNGSFSSGSGIGNKITLLTTGGFASPPVWADPPHFSIDLRSGGRAYQHVETDRPAYSLLGSDTSTNYRSANRDAGVNIEVAVIGHPQPSEEHPWTDEQYRNLAWWLQAISEQNGIGSGFHSFSATAASPNAARMAWEQFRAAAGVLGIEHSPYDTGKYGPGRIRTEFLMDAMRGSASRSVPVDTSSYAVSVVRQAEFSDKIEQQAGVSSSGTTPDTSSQEYAVRESSVAGKPFRFNPPLHIHSLPNRVDFGSSDPGKVQSEYFDERGGGGSVEALQGLRLGRIIQHEMAAGMASTNAERYGFRFLYNPASMNISSSSNDSVVLDHQSVVSSAISGINQNFQTISFMVLLNRLPDVITSSNSRSNYIPGISEEDLAGIKKYGTHWDLEILYRLCNGVFTLKDRGRTSDIGMIIPSNARLLLGPGQNHFGFVESISYNDLMFSRDMVPVRTEVDILFRRHVDMAPEDSDFFHTSLSMGMQTSYTLQPSVRLARAAGASTWIDIVRNGIAAGLGNALNFVGDVVGDVVDPFVPGDQGTPNPGNTPGSTKDAPVPSARITCPFGRAGSAWSCGRHTGDDYSASSGTIVRTTKSGVVFYSGSGGGWGSSYGNHVIVESEGIRHLYAHLSSISVNRGQQVAAGSKIGVSGSTGNTSGPHLHYEERKDPYKYNVDCRKPIWGNG